jgi:hypothetical protein
MAENLVDRYLHELKLDLGDLPRSRQNELVAEIREHIDIALAEESTRGEADVRNVLERLGDPADIAKEAHERMGIRPAKAGLRETAAVILLPIGGVVIPLFGWIAGLILLWSSPIWTTRDKYIGSLIIPGGLMLPLMYFLGSAGSEVCGTVSGPRGTISTCPDSSGLSDAIRLAIFALTVAAPIVTAIYLARRANTLSSG